MTELKETTKKLKLEITHSTQAADAMKISEQRNRSFISYMSREAGKIGEKERGEKAKLMNRLITNDNYFE